MSALVHSETRDDDLARLRSKLAEEEARLDERSGELARLKADLDAFRISYRREVGTLHEELDALDLAIAQAELGELSKRAPRGSDPADEPSVEAQSAAPRYTTDAVRKLFRDVAKIIHPDLARDELTRDRRHVLMAEANRAYALGDEEQLRLILRAWEKSPEAVPGSDPEAARLRLVRRLEQIEEEMQVLAAELSALKDSPLWKLKTMVDEATAAGKDLIKDMVRRLKRDIMVAINRLDAMR